MDISEGSSASASSSQDTSKPPRIALLELPTDILANIAAYLHKQDLVSFGNACSVARRIASRYLFASISLGNLHSERMQMCFESLQDAQFAMIRRYTLSLSLPLSDADIEYEEERIRMKWLRVLFQLHGGSLKHLKMHIKLASSPIAITTLSEPRLDSLSMLTQAVADIHLILDFTPWSKERDSTSPFWPVFAQPTLDSIPAHKCRGLSLLNYNSHFGRHSTNGCVERVAAVTFLDFKNLSIIDSNLITALNAMSNMTTLNLEGCTFSSPFAIAYPFSLVRLQVDTSGSQVCPHNTNAEVISSLVHASRDTLQELLFKGGATSKLVSSSVDLPRLRSFSLELEKITKTPFSGFHLPTLTSLEIKKLHADARVSLELSSVVARLPAIKHILLHAFALSDLCEDESTLDELVESCSTRNISLRVLWPVPVDATIYLHHAREFDIEWEPLESHIQKIALQISLPYRDCKTVEKQLYEMWTLEHLRLSFDIPQANIAHTSVREYGLASGLASDYLLPFLDGLSAPLLTVLEICFSSPFTDYMQGFARIISSGEFAAKFPLCKEIRGSITADVQSAWDVAQSHRPMPVHVWLKEMFVKGCKDHNIDIKHLLWQNAKLITARFQDYFE